MLHRVCAGVAEWPQGPFHCKHCLHRYNAQGVQDVTLDRALMHVVAGGALGDLEDRDRARCQRSAAWFRWDGQLWTVAGGERRIPPLAERVQLVRKAA